MELQTKPEMIVSQTGDRSQLLKVTGIKRVKIPSHFSIKEAVIIVLKGEAVLKLTKKKFILRQTNPQ